MPPKKRRRGGIKQRLGAAEDDAGNHAAKSLLVAFLVEQFAWGHFSPQLVQKIAALACADFDKAREQEELMEDLRRLAQIGSRGAWANNAHRDIMAFTTGVNPPEPCAVSMPFKAPLGDRMQSVLLPHEMFASLYHNYPDAWTKYIVPDTATLGLFWAAMQHHPQMAGHPLLQRV